MAIPHGNHYHFIPYTKLSALEEKIARMIPLASDSGKPAPLEKPSKPVEHPDQQDHHHDQDGDHGSQGPTMKIMTTMERTMTIIMTKNMIMVLQLTVLLVKMSKGL